MAEVEQMDQLSVQIGTNKELMENLTENNTLDLAGREIIQCFCCSHCDLAFMLGRLHHQHMHFAHRISVKFKEKTTILSMSDMVNVECLSEFGL